MLITLRFIHKGHAHLVLMGEFTTILVTQSNRNLLPYGPIRLEVQPRPHKVKIKALAGLCSF